MKIYLINCELKINPSNIAVIFDWNDKIRLLLKQLYLKKRKIVIKVFKNLELIKPPLFFKDIIFILLSKNFLLLSNEVKIFTETFFFAK